MNVRVTVPLRTSVEEMDFGGIIDLLQTNCIWVQDLHSHSQHFLAVWGFLCYWHCCWIILKVMQSINLDLFSEVKKKLGIQSHSSWKSLGVCRFDVIVKERHLNCCGIVLLIWLCSLSSLLRACSDTIIVNTQGRIAPLWSRRVTCVRASLF